MYIPKFLRLMEDEIETEDLSVVKTQQRPNHDKYMFVKHNMTNDRI